MNPSPTVPETVNPAASAATAPRRLVALDALRGWDMFWILGADSLVEALHAVRPTPAVHFLAAQLQHTPWAGLTFYDLIFPLFVFIAGVSSVFSLTRVIQRQGPAAAYRRVVRRAALLYVIGVIYYGGWTEGLDHIRWLGVLQRIALAYLGAGMLFIAVRTRGLVVATAALLIAYWAVLTYVPTRDFDVTEAGLAQRQMRPEQPEALLAFRGTTNWVRGEFAEGRNLPNHIDFQYLPGRKWDGAYDPEGLLSTLPAVATCLLGVLAGQLLQTGRSPQRKVGWLVLAGLGGLALGTLWGVPFPIIKKLWTSSYVLVAGGWSCLFLAAFLQVIEVWQVRRWAQPFVWIGMNPITLYLTHRVVPFTDLFERAITAVGTQARPSDVELIAALLTLAMTFLIAWAMHRCRLFIRL